LRGKKRRPRGKLMMQGRRLLRCSQTKFRRRKTQEYFKNSMKTRWWTKKLKYKWSEVASKILVPLKGWWKKGISKTPI
jgi:hypothetical protein